MKKQHLLLTASLLLATSAMADNTIPNAPAWSTPARGSTTSEVVDVTVKHQIEGSALSYTQTEIDNKFSAPDWFPLQHQPMPNIVQFGKNQKCGLVHLVI